MSGFFGIFSPASKIDAEVFEQMRKASEREGFDGMETVVDDHIAMGHLMLRVSPESKYDKQPLRSSCGNYLLVGHFRLDYRDELGDKLGLVQSELEKTPDSVLAMMAYQKWKEKCVDHLEGDWAFVVYDYCNGSLMMAKEKTGFSSLFYAINNNNLYFSSDLQVLSEVHSLDKKIDLEQFYRISIPGGTTSSGFTLLKNFFCLTAATRLLYNSSLIKKEYKSEIILEPENFKTRYHFVDDYVFDLKSIYSMAIKSRLKASSEIGLLLSSGLDSSSVAYFTAKELEFKGDFLHTYTSYPLYMDKIPSSKHHLVDESHLVKEFVKQLHNVKANYLNFPDANYNQLLESSRTNDYLNPILNSNTFWVDGIIQMCSKTGIRSIYSGQLGNFTVSWNAPYLYGDLICKGKVFKALKFLFCYSRLNSISLVKAVKEKLFAVYYRQFLLVFRNFKWSILLDKKNFSDLSKSFFSKHSELLKINIGFISGFTFFYNSTKTRSLLVSMFFENTSINIYNQFARNGLIFIDPTSDIRLLKFLFSIPDEIFNYMGEEKFIYKKMMKGEGFLQFIDTNNRRLQSLDIPFRLIKSFHTIVKKFSTSNASDFIDLKSLNKLLSELYDGEDDYLQKRTLATNLLRKLSLINFISKNNSKFENYE